MFKLLPGGPISRHAEDFSIECLIMAYVDGELDEAERGYVQELLESSEEARHFAEMMQLTSILVRSAYPRKKEETS